MPLPRTLPSPHVFTRESAPSLRWGVLATGTIATAFTRAVLDHTDQKVVAVASRSVDRARTFATSFGIPTVCRSYEELVAHPSVDVVYVAAPASEHLPLAFLAVSAGKHVLVEKPFTTSAAEAGTLVTAARDAGVFAMEAMWTRYLPQSDVVRQLIADGVLGDVEVLIADHGQAIPLDSRHRLYRPELGGGALLDLGIYPIQLSSDLFGAPARVVATGTMTTTGVDEYASVALEHPGRQHATISTGLVTRTPGVAMIAGTTARIDIAGPFHAPTSLTVSSDQPAPHQRHWTDPTGLHGYDGLAWQATALARYVGEGRTESPLHTLDETISILATIDEARRQVAEGNAA